jgi:hypothetical protein
VRKNIEDAAGYAPISMDEVESIVDQIVDYNDDRIARAFTRLLNGIVHASYNEANSPCVESIVICAIERAFAKTQAFDKAHKRFIATLRR